MEPLQNVRAVRRHREAVLPQRRVSIRRARPGKDQAKHFLEIIAAAGGLLEGDLSPVADFETSYGASPSTMLKCLEDWLEHVETETKRRPIIYTGPSFWTTNKLGTGFWNYPLWVAHYGRAKPNPVPGWDKPTFWQYTDEGKVVGIKGNVDCNWFYGDLEDLAKLRTSSETTGLDYGRFPKMIRRVKRAFKVMPRVKS